MPGISEKKTTLLSSGSLKFKRLGIEKRARKEAWEKSSLDGKRGKVNEIGTVNYTESRKTAQDEEYGMTMLSATIRPLIGFLRIVSVEQWEQISGLSS